MDHNVLLVEWFFFFAVVKQNRIVTIVNEVHKAVNTHVGRPHVIPEDAEALLFNNSLFWWEGYPRTGQAQKS